MLASAAAGHNDTHPCIPGCRIICTSSLEGKHVPVTLKGIV
jgi:hypothetical protein